MIDLGVNIDHVATLRQVRGTLYPDPVEAALQAEMAGADVITLHLREDRRHIQDEDVERLRPLLKTRMNFECAINESILDIVFRIQPHDVCLVPERRQEITTEGGLNISQHFVTVKQTIQRLKKRGIRVSLFIDPDKEQIRASQEAGAFVVELHTGRYADAITSDEQIIELQRIQQAVDEGLKQGLKVNAGHGLHYQNVQKIAAIPGIAELNIGHAIVAHALFVGWGNAVREMKAIMVQARLSALRY